MTRLPMFMKRLFFAGFCIVAGTLLPAAVFAGDPWLQEVKLIASDGDANHRFGQAVALSGDTALVSRQDPAAGPLSESRVYVIVFDGEDWIEQTTLFPDDHPVACSGHEEDQCPFFGWSVALDGDVAVVGAPTDTNTLCDNPDPKVCNDPQPGATYIFVRDGGVWSQQAKLMASGDPSEDQFGQSVAIRGDAVLIGAPAAEVDGHAKQGSAYVFVFDGQDWIEQERLTPAIDFPVDPCSDTTCPFFGNSVALWGGTALVGAANMQVDGNNQQGAAYVFTRDAGVWTEQAMLTAAEGDADHRFGSAVALSEDIALVGAASVTIDFFQQGAAYVFTRDGGIWSEHARLLAADAALAQQFGGSVALTDGMALIGATEVFSGNGSAYMFTIEDGAWAQQIKLTAADGAAGDRFGNAVALSGGVAVVGAVQADISGNSNQGAAYVFVEESTQAPELVFSPAALNFGDVEVDDTSALLDATLSNDGDGEATGLAFNSPDSGFAVDTSDCDGGLQAGQSCQVNATFTPAAPGPVDATLHVDSDQAVTAELALAGNGTGGEPLPGVLQVTPPTHDFGDMEVGDADVLTVSVANGAESGAEDLAVDAVGLTGDAVFAISGGACAPGTVLSPGESCVVEVTFSPDSQASFSGTLTVGTADDQDATVTMQGSGTGAMTDPSTVMVTLQPDGSQFDRIGGANVRAVMSEDGRYVAFKATGSADVLSTTAYRHDLWTGVVEPVSVNIEGGISAVSKSLAISPDGRHVFFIWCNSGTSPPVPDGPPRGLYVRDMDAGVTELIELPTTDGALPDFVINEFAVSADGRIIAFTSRATNLVSGEYGFNPEYPEALWRCAYVLDRDTNTVERVSVGFDGGPLDQETLLPAISADGRYVGFNSLATNLVPDDTNGVQDIFLHDRVTGVTERVSVAFDGSEQNDFALNAGPPAVSGDGRYVVFDSVATNLVPGDTNGTTDVFIRDRASETTERVSVASDGSQGNNLSAFFIAISSDGRYVAFSSGATNLVSGDTNGVRDAFIHDRATGVTERVSLASDGSQGNGVSGSYSGVAVSANGRYVGFSSLANNLVPNDTNNTLDYFVRDRGGSDSVALGITPNPLDFGQVPVGGTVGPSSVTLTSAGVETVTVSDISGTGAPFAAVGGSCEQAPFTLAPGESCTLDFTFEPTGPGAVSASVSITSDALSSPDVVTLRGTGADDPGGSDIFRDRFEENS